MNIRSIKSAAVVALALTNFVSFAQSDEKSAELVTASKEALHEMVEDSPKIQTLLDNSYGYVVFPRVTKGAVTIGGAAGNGIVYKDHKVVSTSRLKQLAVGFQLGVQQYSEVIFFENKVAFNKFMNFLQKLFTTKIVSAYFLFG